jgi:hypothetical protein
MDIDAKYQELQKKTTQMFSHFNGELNANMLLEERNEKNYDRVMARLKRVQDRYMPQKKQLVSEVRALAGVCGLRSKSSILSDKGRERLLFQKQCIEGFAFWIEMKWKDMCENAEKIAKAYWGPTTKWLVEKRESKPLKATETGKWLSTEYNKLVTSGLSELKKIELDAELEKHVNKYVAGALPDDVPADIKKKFAKEVATALRRHPYSQNLTNALENFMIAAADYLHEKMTFKKVEKKIKEDVHKTEKLNPGEDTMINQQVKPLQERVKKKEEVLKKKVLEIKNYFKIDFKFALDTSVFFLKEVTIQEGIQFKRDDFKSKVYVKANIKEPFVKKGGTVTVSGIAEVQKGKFQASLIGTGKIMNIYTDPQIGQVAEVLLNLKYTDPKISGGLTGKAIIPVREPIGDEERAKLKLDVDANVKYKVSGPLTLTGSAGTTLEKGSQPLYRFGTGFNWDIKKTKKEALTLSGTLSSALQPGPGGKKDVKGMLTLNYRF